MNFVDAVGVDKNYVLVFQLPGFPIYSNGNVSLQYHEQLQAGMPVLGNGAELMNEYFQGNVWAKFNYFVAFV